MRCGGGGSFAPASLVAPAGRHSRCRPTEGARWTTARTKRRGTRAACAIAAAATGVKGGPFPQLAVAPPAEGEQRPGRREPDRAAAPGQHSPVVHVGEREMDRADHHRGRDRWDVPGQGEEDERPAMTYKNGMGLNPPRFRTDTHRAAMPIPTPMIK